MDDVRIETEASFMLDIVRDVQKGRAAPAAFQRPFVWTAADVEALWTSILRGYPLGAFLLWRPRGGIVHSRPTLGPIPLRPDDRASLILDGQNRLVTIAWSMTDPDEDVPEGLPGSEIFRAGRTLVLDPYEKRARFVDAAKITGMMMPIHHLFGTISPFIRKAWRSDEDDAAMAWLDDQGYRLRGARIVRTTIDGATPEQAREAFLHIARAGVPMSQADFDAAVAFDPDA
jgi:hypothetical protein